MANNQILKSAIQDVIKQNGNNEITGIILQQALLSIINSLGKNYQYAGIATLSTVPGTPDQNIFYIASQPGTYNNFGGIVVDNGTIAILRWNGTWSKEDTVAITKTEVYRVIEDFEQTIREEIENYAPIIIEGNVVNAPDEEDITTDSNDLLKFKNRNNLYSQYGYFILRKDKTFSEQVTLPNTIYEIKYDFDLTGENPVTLPENSVLLFNGGVLKNNTINGNETTIVCNSGFCFDNVILGGTYQNSIGHISWFKNTNDITKQLSSLIACFKKIYLEYGGIVSDSMPQILSSFELDGCGSIINPQGCNHLFWTGNGGINRNMFIGIKNLVIDFLNNDGINTRHNQSPISIANDGTTNIHDITIQNFATPGVLSNFAGIDLYTTESSCINVNNVRVINCIATSDGVETTGYAGICNAISVSGNLMSGDTCGPVLIENCYIDYIQTVDENGALVKDDATGIYIALAYFKNGKNVLINNCSFKDCGKRNIKLQGSNIVIKNIKSQWSESLDTSLAQYYIGSQYSDNITIENCFGRYPGSFFKMSEGDGCKIRNCELDVGLLIDLGGNTNANAIVENCNVICDHAFECTISSLDQEHTPPFTGIPDVGIVVKNSVVSCTRWFAYVANDDVYFRQYGKMILDNCTLKFHNALCSQLKDIDIQNCNITFDKDRNNEILYVSNSLIVENSRFYCSAASGTGDQYLVSCGATTKETIVRNCNFENAQGVSFTNGFYLANTSGTRIFENITTTTSFINFIYSQRNARFTGNLSIKNVVGAYRFRFANNLDIVYIENSPTSYNNTFDILTNAYANSDFKLYVRDSGLHFGDSVKKYITNLSVGAFSNKPVNPDIGFGYFCVDKTSPESTTSGMMIFAKTTTTWVDALGRVIS